MDCHERCRSFFPPTSPNRSVTPAINLAQALKFVPQFEENNVAEFFVSFERIAARLEWPQEYWTTLIQSKLVGRAQKVYVTLEEDLSSDYESVKAIVLKAYELVPEAYRQRFRNLQKCREQTFVEFARSKEQYASDWLKSKEVVDFDKLKELMLVEEFKRCVPDKLKVHLEELKLDTIQEVAIASDEYYLSHKHELEGVTINKSSWVRTGRNNNCNNNNIGKRFNRGNYGSNHQGNHQGNNYQSNTNNNNNNFSPNRGYRKPYGYNPEKLKALTCFFCNKKGHVKRNLKLAIVDKFPVKDVDIVIGNDVALKNNTCPILVNPDHEVAVVTRSSARIVDAAESTIDVDLSSLDRSGSVVVGDIDIMKNKPNWTVEELIKAQKKDFQDISIESGEVPDLTTPKFKIIKNILYRLSRPMEANNADHEILKQIMVPYVYRNELIALAHESGLAGHFGIHKTSVKLLMNYYWPKLKADVKKFVNSCDVCQKVGKPNQPIPKAPLCPIPVVSEPFKEVIIDVVGPLPRTRSGNEYIFTIMDKMSRYPEAIPLRTIKSAKIVDVLIEFFTRLNPFKNEVVAKEVDYMLKHDLIEPSQSPWSSPVVLVKKSDGDFSDDWETHLKRIRALFEVLKKAGLVINLKKSEFAKAKVVYLGHEVGGGKVAPKQANIECIEKMMIDNY
ncbi:uncharacterized protein [Macrobrachium rosenbergii]|uniref:uncharacterized protein n=1 Tax=Macrobrachium rosenbergii TaxID=79674 RepID=UPI0034D5EF22